jgi:hypothetical protein
MHFLFKEVTTNMHILKLQQVETIPLSQQTPLCLEYYLVETVVRSTSLYGIRIQSYYPSEADSKPAPDSENHSSPRLRERHYTHSYIQELSCAETSPYAPSISSPTIHAEEVCGLSPSVQEVLDLIRLCGHYHVTPTDLFSALDVLMS